MRFSLPLFASPLVFLAMLTAQYAMVPWACENQHRFALHVLAVAGLAIVLALLRLAWRNWRATGVAPADDQPELEMRLRFVAVLGLMLTALITVGMTALWLTQFVLSPCVR